jgi:hypothetical protein
VEFDFRGYFAFGNNRSRGPLVSGVILALGPLVGSHRPPGDDAAPSRRHSVGYKTRTAPITPVRTPPFFSRVSSLCHHSPLRRPPPHSPFSLSIGRRAKHSHRVLPSSPLLDRAGRSPSVPHRVPFGTDRRRSPSFSPPASHHRARFHKRRVTGALSRLLLVGKPQHHCRLPHRHRPQLSPSAPPCAVRRYQSS